MSCKSYSSFWLTFNITRNVNNIGIFRFGRAVANVGCIAYDYRTSVYNLKDDSDETLEKWSQCHTRSANKLLKLCIDNGGLFIKVGQHIAALDYLVPPEYVQVLKVLHNKAPVSSFEEVKKVINTELGVTSIDQVFSEFDPVPVGAASLAQVHRAVLRDGGDVVAVKVQHPRVSKHVLVDTATMEFLFSVTSKIFPDFDFNWLADETRKNLPLELDFVREGHNSETISDLLKDYEWLKVPKIYWNVTTKKLLIMQFVEGVLISNRSLFKQSNIDCSLLSERLNLIFSRMIFIDGFVHCDPHPGNVIINVKDKNPDLVLLDHGLYLVSPIV